MHSATPTKSGVPNFYESLRFPLQTNQEAARLTNRAVAKASVAATKVGGSMSEGTLTAKIKSKMALDDHVNGRSINVDTAGSVVT